MPNNERQAPYQQPIASVVEINGVYDTLFVDGTTKLIPKDALNQDYEAAHNWVTENT